MIQHDPGIHYTMPYSNTARLHDSQYDVIYIAAANMRFASVVCAHEHACASGRSAY